MVQVLTNYAAQQRRLTLRYIMPGRARARCAHCSQCQRSSQSNAEPRTFAGDGNTIGTDPSRIRSIPWASLTAHVLSRYRWLRAGQTLFLRLRSEKRARQQIGINLDQERAEHARVSTRLSPQMVSALQPVC